MMHMATLLGERPTAGPAGSSARARADNVTVVLGPTNTGKTHYAIERMLAHPTGLIGLPLRLLAREVYNRVVARVGTEATALVTGEEKIKPKSARYWICTVEAMPRDLDLAFVAIDEIQLAADLDRGHVFTDRLLHRRGRVETLVIGASTMERAIRQLLPGAHILSRPRLSKLTFGGEKKISRLPRRSAIIAFSAEDVYAIAEWVRRQRGGAAVVLGALSPRTRNAQIDMYQNGDVEYVVATDAIGMGLNLDVDHVAFAADRKFDGWQHRRLNPAELAQIAGRAGRHMRDGSFGTTGRCAPLDEETIAALEAHRFDPVGMLQWRSAALDFSSLDALMHSLDALPREPGLTRAPVAADQIALEAALRDADVRRQTKTRADIARLWEVCQIPDYRKLSPAAHADLVLSVFRYVVRAGKIPDDWFARQIAGLDRGDGDIDALSARIAQIRTWTFIANRSDWLNDPAHWQGVARRVEDSLSDALHQRLAQRFVDRRTSVLMKRLRENAMLEAEITNTGDVMVEGQHVGQLHGFRFTADPQADGEAARALNAAAQKALASEIEQRATRVSEAVDDAFVLANDGVIRWLGETVGKIAAGDHILQPRARVLADELLNGAALDMAQRRLDLWLAQHVTKLLGPLAELEKGDGLEGAARGLAFQIGEALGVLERARVAEEMKNLEQTARAALRQFGVRFGAYHLYLPALLKPAPRALAAQLWALKNGVDEVKGLAEVPHLAASGRTSFVADQGVPKGFYRAAGFRVCGERAVRVDILERLADLIRPAVTYRPGQTAGDPPPGAADGDGFVVTVAMTSLAGCSGDSFASILRSLGYQMESRKGPAITVPLVPRASTEPVKPADDAEPAPGDAPADDAAPVADVAAQPEEAAEAGSATASPGDAAVEAPAPRESEPETPVADAAGAIAAEAPVEPSAAGTETAMPEAGVGMNAAEASEAASAPAAVEGEASADAPDGAAPAEEVLIEVWRPHRHHHGPRRHDRAGGRGPHRGPRRDAAAPAGAEAPAQGEPKRVWTPRPPRPEGAPRPEGGERRFDNKPRDGKARFEGKGRPDGKPRFEGKPRFDGNRPPRDERGGGGGNRAFASSEKPRGREPDPNSPFAKLAALKAELEKGKT